MRTVHWICLRVWIALLSFVLLTANVEARTQRMMLPKQSFAIAPASISNARAFCLDVSAETPGTGQFFEAAPAALGDVHVSVAGLGDMSLQEAIDKKVLRVRGTDDYTTLDFESLLADREIRVSVRRNSVVSPDYSYPTSDLAGLPELSAGYAQPSGRESDRLQKDLWVSRLTHGVRKMGINSRHFASGDYLVDPGSLSQMNDWVQRKLSSASDRAFVLQRVESNSMVGRPLYVLYSGNAPPKTFVGNSSLGAAVGAIRTAWRSAGGPSTPRVVLYGSPMLQDFDATRLTMEIAAAGGGGGEKIGGRKPPTLFFDPPGGYDLPGDEETYKGGEWPDLRVTRERGGELHARQGFFTRGTVDLFSRTGFLLGQMVSAVKGVLNRPDAQFAPASDVIEDLQFRIRLVVTNALAEDKVLRFQEGDSPRAEVSIDQSVNKQRFVIFDGDGSVLAVSTLK